MDKKYKIYFLIHPIKLELRYIGQTSQKPSIRLTQHMYYDNKVSKKANWIKKLKKQGLKPLMDIVFSFDTIGECDEKEIFLIKQYKDNGFRLLNDAPGGKSNAGCKRTPETCKKISEMKKGGTSWSKGLKMSKEFCEKLSKSKLGVPSKRKGVFGIVKQSEKTKEKHRINNTGSRNPFYGKKHSQETKNKIRELNKSDKNIKISLLNLKKITTEHRQKRLLKIIGRKHTEEAKFKISEAFRIKRELKKQKSGQIKLF